MDRARFVAVTPMIPAGSDLASALAFYADQLGFNVVWQDDGMAGVQRGGVAFNLVRNGDRHWADNTSCSIGVSGLDALFAEYRDIDARVGPLEVKPWGRREFHMVLPSGVCLQFYEAEAEA
jgi:catechol 2,3-dioxygenase-like lactoylglutathione lyase family enzyme